MGRSNSPDLGGLVLAFVTVGLLVTIVTGDVLIWLPLIAGLVIGILFVHKFIK